MSVNKQWLVGGILLVVSPTVIGALPTFVPGAGPVAALSTSAGIAMLAAGVYLRRSAWRASTGLVAALIVLAAGIAAQQAFTVFSTAVRNRTMLLLLSQALSIVCLAAAAAAAVLLARASTPLQRWRYAPVITVSAIIGLWVLLQLMTIDTHGSSTTALVLMTQAFNFLVLAGRIFLGLLFVCMAHNDTVAVLRWPMGGNAPAPDVRA